MFSHIKKFALLILLAGATSALANTSSFTDTDLRKQLDRLLYPEQYLLDISYVSSDGKALRTGQGGTTPFPGLAFLGGVGGALGSQSGASNSALDVVRSGGIVDVLLVIDTGVSGERAALAREVVARLADAANIKSGMRLNLRRESMLRKPPPELAPLAPKAEPVDAKSSADGAPEAKKDETPPQRTFYDFVENRRDLALRTLFVLWAAIASLVAIVVLITRRSKVTQSITGSGQSMGGYGGADGKRSDDSTSEVSAKAKLAEHDAIALRTAVQKHAIEIVEQANKQPKKVASVLAEWIMKSADSARQAAILLRNCDVVTIESVCQHLHPSDIDKMMDQKTDEIEPFSVENRMVLEQMRSALARLAANKKFVDRPDPLSILKTVSDDNLAKMLEQEDLNSVAVVSAQIPPHRLQKYFAKLSERDHQQLMAAILNLDSVKIEDLNRIAARFQGQLETINDVLIDENTILEATKRVILATKDPRRQLSLAAGLRILKPDMYATTRPDIDLIIDVMYFGPRPMKVLFQSVDGEQLGTAFSSLGLDTEKITDWANTMPEALSAAFVDGVNRSHDKVDYEKAWVSVRATFNDLIANGLITRAECNYAKAQADEMVLAQFNGSEDPREANQEGRYGAA